MSNDFSHLGLMTLKNKGTGKEYYQLRLSVRLGRKTIGLGSDRIPALNLALAIDKEISRMIAANEAVDFDRLKEMVRISQEEKCKRRQGEVRLVEKDDLQILWSKYVDFHQNLGAWEETYVLTHIKTVTSLVSKCPVQKLDKKSDLVEWLFSGEKRSPATSKERLKLIVAAIDWNSKMGNIPRHWGIEYRDLLESIRVDKRKSSVVQPENDSGAEIDIFSVAEVYRILEALKCDAYSRFAGRHSQYYFYVYFCWLTGCRSSEAIALKWKNVDLRRNRILFCEGQVNASGKIIIKKGTKTVSKRYFPVNGELRKLLDMIPGRTGYVFRNRLGNCISQQALNGVWRTLLLAMGIRYRVPYQLRHTMISYHANNDYPIHKLAELVGNSEKIIKECYLRLDIERIQLPSVM